MNELKLVIRQLYNFSITVVHRLENIYSKIVSTNLLGELEKKYVMQQVAFFLAFSTDSTL